MNNNKNLTFNEISSLTTTFITYLRRNFLVISKETLKTADLKNYNFANIKSRSFKAWGYSAAEIKVLKSVLRLYDKNFYFIYKDLNTMKRKV